MRMFMWSIETLISTVVVNFVHYGEAWIKYVYGCMYSLQYACTEYYVDTALLVQAIGIMYVFLQATPPYTTLCM